MNLIERLKQESVAVFGFGQTGQAVVEYLLPIVSSITVLDDAKEEDVEYDKNEWPSEIEWRHQPTQYQGGFDRVLISPGVPGDHPYLRQVRETGVPVWGELELAYRVTEGELWGVTGTNGKSTTTRLLGQILRAMATHDSVVTCGNNGKPLIQAVSEPGDNVTYVVEVSSFQIEGLDEFTPDGVVLTNLGIDHLDRHDNLHEYHGLKWDLVKRCRTDGPHSINRHALSDGLERPWLRDRENVRTFNREKIYGIDRGLQFDSDRGLGIEEEWISPDQLDPILKLYPENLLAALGMVADTISPSELREALSNFSSLPHRVEEIPVNGHSPRIVNDSKATNPHATVSLLDRTKGPLRIVLGGEAKESDYQSLFDRLLDRDVRAVYLCGSGSTVEAINLGLAGGSVELNQYESWRKGVTSAIEDAREDETVLLSPAGTSFDAFDDYKDRGKHFRQWSQEAVGS